MTKTFEENTLGSGIYALYDVWSAATNWSDGLAPANGDDLAYTAVGSGSDQQADDIADLNANSVTLAATATSTETVYVGGNLTVGTLTLTSSGANVAMLEATDTFGTNPTVTIGALGAASSGVLFSYGAGAAILDNAPSDPGAMTYESGNGGIVFLKNAPAASSTLEFYDAAGVIELANPGATISAALAGVQAGDAIELPGARVNNVIYGANAITVTTNLASTTFSNVAYSGAALTGASGFYGAHDPTTGLERVVFGNAVFNKSDIALTGPYANDFRWSDAKNWSAGLVPDSGDVTVNLQTSLAPLVIDEKSLTLASLTDTNVLIVPRNDIIVNGALTVGNLTLLTARSIIADTTLASGVTTASFKVTGSISLGTPMNFIAKGVGASVDIAVADPASFYSAQAGGTLIFRLPSQAGLATISVDSTSLVEFFNPGAAIADSLEITGAGAAIELPGAALASATLTSTTLTVTTNVGTYSFSSLADISGGPLWGLTFARDAATGLEKLTFQKNADALFVAASGAGVVKGSGVLGVGASVTFTVALSSAVTVDTTFGKPTLTLSDGGVATYSGGSGTNALTFVYVVGKGQNTTDLAVSGFSLNGATILDGANDPAVMTGAIGNPAGVLRIFTNPAHFDNDYNDDGTSDVLWRNPTTGALADWSIVNGKPSGALHAIGTTPAGDRFLGSGDFNGDGTTDLLFENTTTRQVVDWTLKNGASPTSHVVGAQAAGWSFARVGDFNGDGASDILWFNAATSQAMVWTLRNNVASAGAPIASPGAGYAIVGAGDFNGDGTTDILWRNATANSWRDWQMSGGKPVKTNVLAAPAAGMTFLGIGDFNGDHTQDVLFKTATGLTAWKMVGGQEAGTLAVDTLALPAGFAFAAIGDFNGDHVSDVLLYNKTTGALDVGLTLGGHISAWSAVGTQSPASWSFAA